MSAQARGLLLVSVLVVFCASAHAQYDNIKDVITRAAGDLASASHTTIVTGALASGICLERTDQTSNRDTCQNQPQEYTFLTYGPTALSSTVNNLASNTGGPQINHISCPVPVNGAQTTCTVGNQHAVASSTSVANTKAFGFSTEVKIGFDFEELNIGGSGSYVQSTEDTTTQTQTSTDTNIAQTAIMVPPGECFILTISSIPTTKSGTVSYTVPIMGGISVWFSDKTDIPGRESEGPHFNWNVPVGAILQYAVVGRVLTMSEETKTTPREERASPNGGYGSGISISGDQATYTGYLDVSATNFDSNVTEVCLDCKTQQHSCPPTPVPTGTTTPASGGSGPPGASTPPPPSPTASPSPVPAASPDSDGSTGGAYGASPPPPPSPTASPAAAPAASPDSGGSTGGGYGDGP